MPRYTAIWFPFLLTDYTARKKPEYRRQAFVIAAPERGRMVVKAASQEAVRLGIAPGKVVADCRALYPELDVLEAEAGKEVVLLKALGEWCIGYTPSVALDPPDGLLLDSTGCAHLWGGEEAYTRAIQQRLAGYGYQVRIAMADTLGTAWALARFGKERDVVATGRQREAIRNLPPAALRLEPEVTERLKKLGLDRIYRFIDMPRSVLRRRFGASLPLRLGQALGHEPEFLHPLQPVEPYQERLPCLEPICTATGIGLALERLLDMLCQRFKNEGVGLRSGIFKAYRIDGDIQQFSIGTGHPSRNPVHLYRLFAPGIEKLEPALGFELFVLEAPHTEEVTASQEALWETAFRNDTRVSELVDRITARIGNKGVRRYLPVERHWPEASIRQTTSLQEKSALPWRTDLPRPVYLLPQPETIEATVRLPDYPPLLFRYKGEIHTVAKADGPERIEQEWWLQSGQYRDYYVVEDEKGARFWVFRSGPYDPENRPKWYLHGFFA
ncbi:MAG TPA: DNA polymerase Y family protein [Flavobacterium sp.]|nr:DNA polymerase Y family protein [Flavobacterium sp.]